MVPDVEQISFDENGIIILETEENQIKINFLEIEKANIDPDWAIENNQTK